MNNSNTATQTELLDAYQIGDGNFTDVACLDCAREFARANKLKWDSPAEDNYTEAHGNGAYASLIHSYEGEADSPYSCCGLYLHTNFTTEGEVYLMDEFPSWVAELYGY
jgi:hypothetical protein